MNRDRLLASVKSVEGAWVVKRGRASVAADGADGGALSADRNAGESVRSSDLDHLCPEVSEEHAEQGAAQT